MQVILKVECALEFPEGLVITSAAPRSQSFGFSRAGVGLEIGILTNFPAMLRLSVLGPHFENH